MRRAAAIPAAPAPTTAMSTCDVGAASTGLAMAAADAARNERRFRIGMFTGVLRAARAASTNLSVRANRSPAVDPDTRRAGQLSAIACAAKRLVSARADVYVCADTGGTIARRSHQSAHPDVLPAVPYRAAQGGRAGDRAARGARDRALSPACLAHGRRRDLGRGHARP